MASPYTFISYAREDSEFVHGVAAELRQKGVSIWLDKFDIHPGDDWNRSVDAALEGCECFLLVVSPNSIASDNVMDELAAAVEDGKRIVPLLYQSCRMPLRIRRLHYIDFTNEYPTAMGELIDALAGFAPVAPSPIVEKPTEPKTEMKYIVGKEKGKKRAFEPSDFNEDVTFQLVSPITESKPEKPVQKAKVQPRHENFTEYLGDGVKLEMVAVPGGEMMIEWNQKITLAPFFMGQYQITQEQWKEVMGKNPSRFKGDDLPVENVSWEDAQEFCRKVSKQTGNRYRLPSDAEWIYACLAGEPGDYCFGDDENRLKEFAWYNENSGKKTHPVGEKKPNAWGLYDMHGNVWEWCENRDKTSLLLHGGSWADNSTRARAYASDSPSSYPTYGVYGIRVVISSRLSS